MVAFATYQDLEARWRTLSAAEQAKATILLDDASAIMRAECPDADTVDAGITKFVACGMVKRAMLAGDVGGEGVSQVQQTAGPFSHNQSFANPSGNLYLTKQDRRLLGCLKQSAGMVNMGPETDYAPENPTTPLNWWELNL